MTLDEAWAEAEAALPEGWRIISLSGGVDWVASAQPTPANKSVPSLWRGDPPATMWLGRGAHGNSPAAALHALAEALGPTIERGTGG